MSYIQPGGKVTISFRLGRMPSGGSYWVARYVNGQPQSWWNGWPLTTIRWALTDWIQFEKNIGSVYDATR